MFRFVDSLQSRVEDLPDTIRPAVYGALFIVLFMLMRGAWIVAPIAIVYVLVSSDKPAADLTFGALVVAFAMFGGGLSGLSYGLLGRHLRTAVPGGHYLTGVVTISPYMFVLPFILRLIEHEPILRPLTGEDVGIAVVMSLLFGGVMGHSWFAPGTFPEKARTK